MNRIYIAIAAFLLVLIIGVSGLAFINYATKELIEVFEEVNSAARLEQQDLVQNKLSKLIKKWSKYEPLLSSILRHEDIDQVGISIFSLIELNKSQDMASICLECNRMISKLRYILESEIPSYKNLL